MPDSNDPLREKVAAIFRELAGGRAETLDAARLPAGITSTFTAALAGTDSTEAQILHADQIAFHLTDWSADAAFLLAVHLFPERFTPEEIREGVEAFLVHVPHHIIAAARLGGYSTEDIFTDD
ncbi:MAG: hypothetical protein WCS70_11970 [Verrucomicrobiota bacterium]